ncbi:MAG TPA: thioredoxin domain-containing protein [Gemmatimonadaceae bacterium]|nr:thioredoxin domain-containing protein [Gemmatimonadaceae bacterium]
MVKVQPKKTGYGKFYALLVGIAVVAGAAIYKSSGEPKVDAFAVDPNLPPVQVEGYRLGNPDAPVEVLEWADFECPGCMQFATVTEPDVRERLIRTGQISYRFFFFPLPDHKASAAASYAAACAGDQNKFWEMHDAIFNGFNDWSWGRVRDPKGVFKGYAERLGLDIATWEACYDSDKHHALITSHKAEGLRRGVNATPTFVIGNRMVSGAIGYDQFKALVDSAMVLAGAKAPAAPTGGDTAATRAVPVAPAAR